MNKSLLLSISLWSITIGAMEEPKLGIPSSSNSEVCPDFPTAAHRTCAACQEQKESTQEICSSNFCKCDNYCGHDLCKDCVDFLREQNLSKCPWCNKLNKKDTISIDGKTLRKLFELMIHAPITSRPTTSIETKKPNISIDPLKSIPDGHVHKYWRKVNNDYAEIKFTNNPTELFMNDYMALLKTALETAGYIVQIEKRPQDVLFLTIKIRPAGKDLWKILNQNQTNDGCKYDHSYHSENSPILLMTLVGIVKIANEQIKLQSANLELIAQINESSSTQIRELEKEAEKRAKIKELLSKLLIDN